MKSHEYSRKSFQFISDGCYRYEWVKGMGLVTDHVSI